jgi:ADP-dependent NAD(P)H-hydrate dehydratase / NAD(P)H-hydrate epimerase
MRAPIELLAVDATGLALHGVEASRRVEALAQASSPEPSLMERAGLAVARLAMAVEPHARSIVVAVGPGNNGGDGLLAARDLHAAGRRVVAVLTRDGEAMPPDARSAFDAAREAGVPMVERWPDAHDDERPSLVIDALLGIGAQGQPRGRVAEVWRCVEACTAPRLAVDVPSGLDADRGTAVNGGVLAARDTLTLLSVKPGLFIAHGRDACGRVWFDDLGVDPSPVEPTARLAGRTLDDSAQAARQHAQHKGSFGDVAVVGGARGMSGALLLAARAALAAGAGRVYAVALDAIDAAPIAPELMWRDASLLAERAWLGDATVVAGCGGGARIRDVLALLLSSAPRLVLDADALNALADDPQLCELAGRRARKGMATVLTPHPLEAARLLGLADARAVQADRLDAARRIAQRFDAVVALKGSGTVIDDGRAVPWVNPSGNALLATAGTGDVLAGWIGGAWSSHRAVIDKTAALSALVAAAAWRHGHAADRALRQGRRVLPAGAVIEAMTRA